MRAAVLHAVGEPMRLEDVRLAEPRSGEVLVRVQVAGVCHSDLHFARLPGESVGRGLILIREP